MGRGVTKDGMGPPCPRHSANLLLWLVGTSHADTDHQLLLGLLLGSKIPDTTDNELPRPACTT